MFSCTILFSFFFCADPDVDYIEALAPYQPVMMRVVSCPIDTRLSFTQANKLIKDLKPRHLVIPEFYSSPPSLFPGEFSFFLEYESFFDYVLAMHVK